MQDKTGTQEEDSISALVGGERAVNPMCGRLGHAPGVAGRADTTAFAGEGHKEVVPAFLTAGAGKVRTAESPNL